MAARDFSFSPAELATSAGGPVNVVLVNQGEVLHDLTIPALGLRLVAPAGATASGALSAPGAGRYEVFCSVPGHRDVGMAAVLVVA